MRLISESNEMFFVSLLVVCMHDWSKKQKAEHIRTYNYYKSSICETQNLNERILYPILIFLQSLSCSYILNN